MQGQAQIRDLGWGVTCQTLFMQESSLYKQKKVVKRLRKDEKVTRFNLPIMLMPGCLSYFVCMAV